MSLAREDLEKLLQPPALAFFDWMQDLDVRLWQGPLRSLMIALMINFEKYGDPEMFMRDLSRRVIDEKDD